MAVSLTPGPALTQLCAAPRPPRGLPQPIRPTRMTSLPDACALAATASCAAATAPATALVFKNSRRELEGELLLKVRLLGSKGRRSAVGEGTLPVSRLRRT